MALECAEVKPEPVEPLGGSEALHRVRSPVFGLPVPRPHLPQRLDAVVAQRPRRSFSRNRYRDVLAVLARVAIGARVGRTLLVRA